MSDIRVFLSGATDELHRAVEARAAEFVLDTRRGFDCFLAFLWRGYAPVEAALTEAGAARVLDQWPQRIQSNLLEAEVGAHLLPKPKPCRFHGEAEVWGGIYVLEGSRLGLRMLARETPYAATSAVFRAAECCRFWPVFIGRLRAADRRLSDRRAMATGAQKVFRSFLAANG